MVTLVAPVAAALDMLTLLGPGASIVIAAVKLFTCQPVVMTVHRSVQIPMAALLTTELSERHTVATTGVAPTRTRLLKSRSPLLRDTTVTLIDPDDAAVAIITLLGAGASIVIDAVKLFICQPVVMMVRRSVQMPIACLATIELSDRQCVA